jgi:hypothetical protein
MAFKYYIRYIFSLLASATFFYLAPFAVAIGSPPGNPDSTDSSQHTIEQIKDRQDFSRFIDKICLYEVIRGERRKTLLERKDLEKRSAIVSDGYIYGVELISKNGRLSATLEERPMDILGEDAGGSDEAVPGAGTDGIQRVRKLYRYTYFPKVPGDAVSMKDYFFISIESENVRYDLPVRQNGYQILSTMKKTRPLHGDELLFRYLGADLAQFETSLHDFKGRLAALSDGIEFIEKTIDGKLVRYVNIVEHQGSDNAWTSWGQDQIWIYADTFRNQRISELRSMAEHETLHIFIDRQGYARQIALRGLFSDLHGFQPLSLERFSIVSLGKLPPGVILSTGKTSPLFAFINERNFIPGMSGGHAGDNLDEFCASFLHALLYIDQLPKNIDKSELVMADGSLQALLPQGRKIILRDFRRTLDMFVASAPDDNLQKSARFSTKAFAIFDKSMNVAARVNFSD